MSLAINPQIHLAARSLGQAGSEQELRAVCEKFEAFFVQALFKSMRQTIPDEGFIKKSNAQKWFEEFMDAEVSMSLAEKNCLGVAEALYQQMSAFKNPQADEDSSIAEHLQIKG